MVDTTGIVRSNARCSGAPPRGCRPQLWHAGLVTPAPGDRTLWLTVPDVAQRLGVPVTVVRRMLEDRELLASRRGERGVLRVPAAFLAADGPLPALRGTVTVLGDGGMSDEEVIDWLLAPDDTLPVPGAAIDSLHAGFKTEVRRRAMEAAW